MRAVYRALGLADFDDDWAEQAWSTRPGSKDVPAADLMTPLAASRLIRDTGVTMLDVIEALADNGFEIEAERMLAMLRERVRGDYLQTAAIFDEQMNVLSAVTDPNDYAGPGTGYTAHAGPAGRDRRHPAAAVGRPTSAPPRRPSATMR